MTSKGSRYVVNKPAPMDDVNPTSETVRAGVPGESCTKKMMKAASANSIAARTMAIGTSGRSRTGPCSSSSTFSNMITNTTNTMHSIAGSARQITIAKASVWIVRRRLGVAMECMAAIVTWAALQS